MSFSLYDAGDYQKAECQVKYKCSSLFSLDNLLSTHVPNCGDVFRQAAGASRLATILATRAWRS